MDEAVKVNYSSERPTVLGRELHEALGIDTPYSIWFRRMCEYGFSENTDFVTDNKNVTRADGAKMPQIKHDHQLSLEMAKEISMLQRSDKGKQVRQYFIAVEQQWNAPELVLLRAAMLTVKKIECLTDEVNRKNQIIAGLLPKSTYQTSIQNFTDSSTISQIAEDYAMSGKDMNTILHRFGVQFHRGGQWILYSKHCGKGYTYRDAKKCAKWTRKGRLFIYQQLKENGILPAVETK